MKKIKFVYFDLDDTILDHRTAEKKSLADLKNIYADEFGALDLTYIQEVYHKKNVVLWRDYSDGKISKENLRARRFSHLLDALSIESLAPLDVSATYLDRYAQHWDYCDGAREGFFSIADHFPVGVLTNGFAEAQHAKLNRFPEIRSRCEACVISEEVGYMKPHPRLFEHAERLVGVQPEEILYVGDSMHSDVNGGTRAGWDVIWYAPQAEAVPEEVVHAADWGEVVEIVLEMR